MWFKFDGEEKTFNSEFIQTFFTDDDSKIIFVLHGKEYIVEFYSKMARNSAYEALCKKLNIESVRHSTSTIR